VNTAPAEKVSNRTDLIRLTTQVTSDEGKNSDDIPPLIKVSL